jgi:hypothetical protein
MSELERQVFVFTGATLESALDEWLREQIAAYPQREDAIRIAALAMRDFLTSPAARRHKMSMAAPQGRTPGGLG